MTFSDQRESCVSDDKVLCQRAVNDNILWFNYEFTAQVEKHLVIGTVWEVQFTDEDFRAIDLNQELYEECLERTRGVEERDMTDVDEEELEEEQDPRFRTTSSGRILRLPNRF